MLSHEIRPGEIKLNDKIGEGAFGRVYRGKCRGQEVAIKLLHEDITETESLQAFRREVATVSSFSHPNICLFMGACTQPGSFFIVQELMAGDVEQLLHSDLQISLWRRMVMARDAALGVNWLHGNTPIFIHRDLKTSNLLYDSNYHVKVCDFGLSQVKNKGQMLKDDKDLGPRGTPVFMAPEVLQCKKFNEKADVYSFGIILWEFLTKKAPFTNHNNYEKFSAAVCGGERPPVPVDTEPSLKFLMEECWSADPNTRPHFPIIIQRLNHVIVDLAIKDSLGRQFWKKNFLAKEVVPFKSFAGAFDDFLCLPSDDDIDFDEQERMNLNLRCLKAILTPVGAAVRSAQLNVDLETFGEFCQWFGPIYIPKDPAKEPTILDHVRTLMQQPWFFGRVDTATAEQKLSGRPEGTFLVRFSSQVPGWYTISLIQGGEVVHKRISHSPGKPFFVNQESYNSLLELVAARHLTLPCEGPTYASLFNEKVPNYQ